jgi:hypothetical protein
MTDATYSSLVLMVAKLIHDNNKNLDPMDDIVLHSFFTNEKECHKYFVRNPDKFNKFKLDVKHALDIYDDSMITVVTDYGYTVSKTGSVFGIVKLNPDGSVVS